MLDDVTQQADDITVPRQRFLQLISVALLKTVRLFRATLMNGILMLLIILSLYVNIDHNYSEPLKP